MSRRFALAALGAVATSVAVIASSLASAAPTRHQAVPIPVQTLRQIKAEYGRFTYVPGFAPRGFIFTSWRVREPAYAYLMERLSLTFGRSGTRLIWTVSDGRDQDDYADCSKRPYYQFKRSIGGRLIYYARGNHGDSAWTCLKQGTGVVVGIDLWIQNDSGRPPRLTAMRMVASAKRA